MGIRETFTVRKISFGVGVERTFPVHSPSIAKLEVVQRGRVRRAKLYYLRDLRGKKARIKERRIDDAKLAAMEAAAEQRAAEAAADAADVEVEAGPDRPSKPSRARPSRSTSPRRRSSLEAPADERGRARRGLTVADRPDGEETPSQAQHPDDEHPDASAVSSPSC